MIIRHGDLMNAHDWLVTATNPNSF